MLNWSSYYFEILKMDSDAPALPGEKGRIVVTDLYNKSFPMIRYDTGDIGVMEQPKNDFPYFSNVMGRRMDLIYDENEEIVAPMMIDRNFEDIKFCWQWQFIQEDKHSYRILYNPKDKEKAKKEIEEKIKLLKKIFGEKSIFHIEEVKEIPVLSSGKRKLIAQHWKEHP